MKNQIDVKKVQKNYIFMIFYVDIYFKLEYKALRHLMRRQVIKTEIE